METTETSVGLGRGLIQFALCIDKYVSHIIQPIIKKWTNQSRIDIKVLKINFTDGWFKYSHVMT